MSIENEAKEILRKLEEELSTKVSIALFGQPGAGKSSLINKILGKKVAEVGVETDKTIEEASYEANGLKFVDLPGYGTKNFPKDTYFQRFNIQQFDLFLCVTSGKLHQADTEFFQALIRNNKVCIFVVNQHDKLWEGDISIEELEQRKRNDIEKHVGKKVTVLFTSCKHNTGLDELTHEINNNLDAAKQERWLRSAKAYSLKSLEEKRIASEKHVSYATVAAAVNAINPVPGVDVAVDISIIMNLFQEIRDSYGLSDNFLANLQKSSIPVIGRLVNNVVRYAAKEGLFNVA